jgi:hypothetical protein
MQWRHLGQCCQGAFATALSPSPGPPTRLIPPAAVGCTSGPSQLLPLPIIPSSSSSSSSAAAAVAAVTVHCPPPPPWQWRWRQQHPLQHQQGQLLRGGGWSSNGGAAPNASAGSASGSATTPLQTAAAAGGWGVPHLPNQCMGGETLIRQTARQGRCGYPLLFGAGCIRRTPPLPQLVALLAVQFMTAARGARWRAATRDNKFVFCKFLK